MENCSQPAPTTAPMRPKRSKLRKILIWFLVIFAGLLVLGVGYIALLLINYSAMFPNETTDVGRYGEVLKQWSGTGLVSHFPATIPSQARNVRFAELPQILQGGGYIQLRLQLPAGEIQQIEAQLKQAAVHTYIGGGSYDHYNEDQKNNVPTTNFYTGPQLNGNLDFPEHYTLYVLQAHSYYPGSWNHGHTCGVAVSSTANEVVYWTENW